jgi:pimeloyl-ACP methyl ester carboxylesterase
MRRREFVVNLGLAGVWPLVAQAQQAATGGAVTDFVRPGATLKRARTKTLEIAYEESGPESGLPVLLMHGFPYDPRAYDGMVPPLVAAGCRAIVPYLRGYGPTRFLSPQTLRSGQQAALGQDLLDLMDATRLQTALLVGFDWGGRGACVVSALWPERVRGLVTAGGYNIQTSRARSSRQRRNASTGCGTSTISTPSAAARGSPRAATTCASSCGSCGHRAGSSTTRPTSAPRRRSTIPTSSTS